MRQKIEGRLFNRGSPPVRHNRIVHPGSNVEPDPPHSRTPVLVRGEWVPVGLPVGGALSSVFYGSRQPGNEFWN